VPAEQLPTGTIIVRIGCDLCAGIQRGSNLEHQRGRVAEYASRERLTVIRSVSEIGSGWNGHRAKIMRLRSDPAVQTIAMALRDRLARFGSEYIEAALAACGRKLIVVDQTEMKAAASAKGRQYIDHVLYEIIFPGFRSPSLRSDPCARLQQDPRALDGP